tara:strand:- start:1596 stop:2231 length:636 start_codon:yes stop_codon:yes gene_type:complete
MKLFTLLAMVLLLMLSTQSFAEEFVREYTYRAGDDDSKNSSRKKALEQIQLELLSEVGVHIRSAWELHETSSNSFAEEDIETITAGITQTDILEESWNGFDYYIRAKLEIDLKDVEKRLEVELKRERKQQKLRRTIASKDDELDAKEKELAEKNREIARLRSHMKRERRVGNAVRLQKDSRSWLRRTYDNAMGIDSRSFDEKYGYMFKNNR